MSAGGRWTLKRAMPPVDLPEPIGALLKGRRASRDRSKPDLPVAGVTLDDPRNMAAFKTCCAEVAQPCVEGQGGNNMLAATGAMAHDYGLSADVALGIALEHHNPRCRPEFEPDEYEKHFVSGYHSASSPLGHRAPARDHSHLFTPRLVTRDGERVDEAEVGGSRYQQLTRYFESVLAASGERPRQAKRFGDIPKFEDRAGGSFAVKRWLIKRAVNALFGESEAFKTYITVYLLLCVATGTPALAYDGFKGYPVDGPRDVIMFAGEGYEDVLDRIETAIEALGFDRALVEKHLIVVSDVYALNRATGLATMADEIEELGARPAIIAVDTYNLALDGNEDSADECKRALKGLRELATMYDAAGLVLHHPGWGNTKRPRGSSAFRANADVLIICERAPSETPMATLTQYKNRSAAKENYRATLVGKLVRLGFDADGEAVENLAFSPVKPQARSDSKSGALIEQAAKANTYTAALEEALRSGYKPLGASEAARGVREQLSNDGQKAPAVSTIRKWLYAVCDAIKGEPEFAAAHFIHSRTPLKFSHPEHHEHVIREPRVSADGLFHEVKPEKEDAA